MNSSSTGSLVQYTLPLTNASVPSLTANPSTAVIKGVAVDPNGNLLLADNANHLIFYSAPIKAPLTSAFTINNGAATTNGPVAFNAAGDLFAFSDVGINVFMHPLSASSTPSQTIPSFGVDLSVDPAGTIYQLHVVQTVGGPASAVAALSPPYSGSPTIATFGGVNGEFTDFDVCGGNGLVFAANTSNLVEVYTTPLQSGARSAFNIPGVQGTLATDGAGNLYVNDDTNTIRVFTAPLSASSVPSVTVPIPGANQSLVLGGLAIGK